MTIAAKRLRSTSMAPYVGVMKGMDVDEMNIVIDFLHEAIRKAEKAKRRGDDDFLAEKMAGIKISPRVQKLIRDTRLTKADLQVERTRYILGEERK